MPKSIIHFGRTFLSPANRPRFVVRVIVTKNNEQFPSREGCRTLAPSFPFFSRLSRTKKICLRQIKIPKDLPWVLGYWGTWAFDLGLCVLGPLGLSVGYMWAMM